MASSKSAWGMEIGACAIKAIRLERTGDDIRVADFAVIPHKKVLTTPDLDQDEMIRLSLGQFISQKSLEGETLVMSLPGHSAFARFAKLPPVDAKKVPDIVKFEAVQQIPFPIDEVEWDYQTFTSDDSPEIEVGIFAITRDRVTQRLDLYSELGIGPEALTLSPVSVYNAISFDQDLKKYKGPLILLDIGTSATDVVVAEEGRCWIRTFPLGGTHFTEAIASAFKLSYAKAEKLKREAATSKYAKQIMQAMRPVFSDLLQDLQRSIGYYQSIHKDAELKMIVGIGSTFKIPGLRKFIGQQLQLDVVRLDEYQRIAVTGREAASFAENSVNMATAYGLALQGIGLAQINVNLVPVGALREQLWHAKTKWFAAAAMVAVVAGGVSLSGPIMDQGSLPSQPPDSVQDATSQGQSYKSQFDTLQRQADVGFAAENIRRLVDYRNIWPHLLNDVATALSSTNPQAELLGDDPAAFLTIDPKQRRFVQLDELKTAYRFLQDGSSRRLFVTMNVQLSHENPIKFLNDTVAQWFRDNHERDDVPYRIVDNGGVYVSLNSNLLQTVTVHGDGSETTQGASGAPAFPPTGAPTGIGGGGRQPGGRPKQGAPGSQAGGGRSPGRGLGAVGEGGRRKPGANRPRRGAPGRGGFGATGNPAPSGFGNPSRPSGGFGPSGSGQPGRGGGARSAGDLDSQAPLMMQPEYYPPDSMYYRLPITFEIEILTNTTPKPSVSADARKTINPKSDAV